MASEQHQENWSPTRIGLLRALWDEGLSASAIGQRLQITKNAVVGKVHRLQLPSRPSPIRPRQAGETATKPAPAPKARRPATNRNVTVIPPKPTVPATLPERTSSPNPKPEPKPTIVVPAAAVDDLQPVSVPRARTQRSCAWPLGHPGTADFRYCGEDAVTAKPYCEQHCCRAYVRLARQDAATA